MPMMQMMLTWINVPSLTLGAAAGDGGDLLRALLLMVVGMAVVFAALVLLMLTITLLSRVGETKVEPAAESAPVGTAKRGEAVTDPKLLAVFAAAATAVLHRPVHVREARVADHSK